MSTSALLLALMVFTMPPTSISAGAGATVIVPGAVADGVVPFGVQATAAAAMDLPWRPAKMPSQAVALLHTELYPGTAGVLGLEMGMRLWKNAYDFGATVGISYAPTRASGSVWPTVSLVGGRTFVFAGKRLLVDGTLRYVVIPDSPSLPVELLVGISYTFKEIGRK